MSADITQRNMRAFQCTYHRNGVTGEGFHVCRFIYYAAGEFENMQAVVFWAKGHVAVTSLDNPDSTWRGDVFENALREAIALSETRNANRAVTL